MQNMNPTGGNLQKKNTTHNPKSSHFEGTYSRQTLAHLPTTKSIPIGELLTSVEEDGPEYPVYYVSK